MAPIVIFAFNRPDSLKATVETLSRNPEAADSDLYIFIDGPRTQEERGAVDEVEEYARSIEGFKTVEIDRADRNRGLGPSIIRGVSKVMDIHGFAIVVEDDLNLSPGFLKFMNEGLTKYREEKEVFSICGYTNKVRMPEDYPYDAYFAPRSSSWGWATWKDRWESVDWKLEPWEAYSGHKKGFNHWGGSDCFSMLEGWKTGANKSWAIRFCFAQYLQQKVSVFPVKSLLSNTGFDGQGTNCKKWSRFKYELMPSRSGSFGFPDRVEVIPSVVKSALRYHSIPRRVWSRMMYMIYG